jgi:hypothetical protein
MDISKKEQKIIFLALLSVILLVIIFKWVNYLSSNDYVELTQFGCTKKEGFANEYINDGYTNTVNMPLTTTYSCKNMCGPTSRCSITGQQCFADIDCPGCQPYSPPLKKSKNTPGDNDSGKLTNGVTPTYSELTTDIGTRAAKYTKNSYMSNRTPGMSNGVNTWRKSFDIGNTLFDSRFAPPQMPYMPMYSKRYSITGEFIENGPLASNSSISKM